VFSLRRLAFDFDRATQANLPVRIGSNAREPGACGLWRKRWSRRCRAAAPCEEHDCEHTYQIAGYLYWRGQLEGKVLQIALPGGSYNHKYWDADDLNGHPYSYARYMVCHGFPERAERDDPPAL